MVVEELDQGDVAIGVAGNRVAAWRKIWSRLLGDRDLLPGSFLGLLTLLQLLDRLVDHLRLAHAGSR